MKYIVGGYSELSFGTDDSMYEALLNRELKPILTTLYNNPSYKFLLRLSVSAYEWIEVNHPEINMLIIDLCRKDQLELLASSYYDSDLSLVPNHERSTHIEKTTTYLRKRFSKRPHGLWFSYQIFNPSVIPVMELSSLYYIVISTFSQSSNTALFNKPFCMSEMGKETVVFPIDDLMSKSVMELTKNEYKVEKVREELKKIIKGSSNGLNTFMLNLDLLAFNEGSSEIFNMIYNIAGNGSTTPSLFLKDHSISKYGYLPVGNYGRECLIGKSLCINQRIFESNILGKNYFCLEILRNCIKNTKKSLDIRNLLDELLMESSSSAMYVPLFSDLSCYRRYSSKKICEMEKLLASKNLLPSSVDISLSHTPSEVSTTRNITAYISPKGGTINKLNYVNSNFDLTLNSESGLFYDSVKQNHGSKVLNLSLSNKNFNISAVDKRRNDFIAQYTISEMNLSILKKYKFRQNFLSVDYEISNTGKEDIKDYLFETLFNLSFDKDPHFNFDSQMISNLQYASKAEDLDFSLIFNEDTCLTTKTVVSNINTIVGNISDYQYTQFKIQKPLTLKPMESLKFSVMMKIDKCKEKNYDIK